MATNNILEIYGNETVSELLDKINANFKQLSSLNGGPQGPAGVQGIPGLPGLQGVQGEKGDKGERGTNIESVEKGEEFPPKEEMIENTLYFGVSKSGDVITRILDENGEITETTILEKSSIDTAGYLGIINQRDDELKAVTVLEQGQNEPAFFIGKSSKDTASTVGVIAGAINFTGDRNAKLYLGTSRSVLHKGVKIEGGNKSVKSSNMIIMTAPSGSSANPNVATLNVSTYESNETSKTTTRTALSAFGVNDSDLDLYVDGNIIAKGDITTNSPANSDTFIGAYREDVESGTLKIGIGTKNSEGNTNVVSGVTLSNNDIVVDANNDVTLNYTSTLNINDNETSPVDVTGASIQLNKASNGMAFKYSTNKTTRFSMLSDDSTLTLSGDAASGLKLSNYKTFESVFPSEDGSFHVSLKDDVVIDGKDKAGIFLNKDRFSVYGEDGIQIKLNRKPTTNNNRKNENPGNATISSDDTNLIEFCYDVYGDCSDVDYYYDKNKAGENYQKIGELVAHKCDFNNKGEFSSGSGGMTLACSNGKLSLKDVIYKFNGIYMDYLKPHYHELYISDIFFNVRRDTGKKDSKGKSIYTANEYVKLTGLPDGSICDVSGTCTEAVKTWYNSEIKDGNNRKLVGYLYFVGGQAFLKINLKFLAKIDLGKLKDNGDYYYRDFVFVFSTTSNTSFSEVLKSDRIPNNDHLNYAGGVITKQETYTWTDSYVYTWYLRTNYNYFEDMTNMSNKTQIDKYKTNEKTNANTIALVIGSKYIKEHGNEYALLSLDNSYINAPI